MHQPASQWRVKNNNRPVPLLMPVSFVLLCGVLLDLLLLFSLARSQRSLRARALLRR